MYFAITKRSFLRLMMTEQMKTMDRHRQHVVLYILLISLGMLVACSGPSEKPAAADKVAAAPSAPQPAVVAPAPAPAPPREEPRMASTSKPTDSTARKSAP